MEQLLSKLIEFKNNLKSVFLNKLGISLGDNITTYPEKIENQIQLLKQNGHTGHVDVEGLRALGWYDSDIQDLQDHVWWDEELDDFYKVENQHEFSYYVPPCSGSVQSNVESEENAYLVLAVTKLRMDSVKSLHYRFAKCRSLTYINLEGVITNSYTTLYGLCYQCYSLKTINFRNCDLSNITLLNTSFYYCYSLEELDLYTDVIGSTKISTMNSTFMNTYSLTYLNLSKFGFSNCNTFKQTFCASGIKYIEGIIDCVLVTSGNSASSEGFYRTFYGNNKRLKHCYLKNVKSSLDLSETDLDVDSLTYLINNIQAPVDSEKTLTLGTLQNKITDSQIASLTELGWTIA